MMTDAKLLFSNAQAITGDAISTNVYTTEPVFGFPTFYMDVGTGTPIFGYILVDTTLDSAGEAATLQITFESSEAANLSSSLVHWDSGTITEATLVAGYKIPFTIPAGQVWKSPYIGFRYNNATEPFTAGNITAVILLDVDKMQKAPNGMKFGT